MYIGELFEALDFTWTGDDGEIYRSLNGLVKNNNGIYKSSKQQKFIHNHYGWTLPAFTNPVPGQKYGRFRDDAQMLQDNFGVPLQQGQRVIAAGGTARWAPGARGARPVTWMFVLDEYGVVAKYKMKYKGDMRAGTHVDPTATVKEWERDPTTAAPMIQQLKQDAQQAQATQAAAVAAQVPSKHIGNVGDRIKGVNVEVEASFGPKYGGFGEYYINKLITPAGEQLIYFGNQMRKGDKMTLSFTVKRHSQDQRTGQPVTQIGRPKKVSAKAAATTAAAAPTAKEPDDLPPNAAPPGTKVEKPLTTAELRAMLANYNAANKVGEGLNEFAPDGSGGDDDGDRRGEEFMRYIDVAKKVNMKRYKPGTANNIIAQKMAGLVPNVDNEMVDFARHVARRLQGVPSMLDGPEHDWIDSLKEGFGDKAPDPKIVKSIQDEKKKKQEQEKKDQERQDRHFKNYKSGNVRANWKKEGIREEQDNKDLVRAILKALPKGSSYEKFVIVDGQHQYHFSLETPYTEWEWRYKISPNQEKEAYKKFFSRALQKTKNAVIQFSATPVVRDKKIIVVINSNKSEDKEVNEASPWQWRKGPGGTLKRTITPQDKEERERSLAAKRKEAYRRSAEGMMLEPLPDFDYDQFSKIVKGSMLFPQVENWEFDPRRDVRVNTPEGPVAGRQYLIMYQADLRKDMGYDDETINSMYGGQDTIEDSLQITIYRDPKNPKRFLVK